MTILQNLSSRPSTYRKTLYFLKATMSPSSLPIEVNLLGELVCSIFLGHLEATVELGALGRVGAHSTVGTASSLTVIDGRESVSTTSANGNLGLGSSTQAKWLLDCHTWSLSLSFILPL